MKLDPKTHLRIEEDVYIAFKDAHYIAPLKFNGFESSPVSFVLWPASKKAPDLMSPALIEANTGQVPLRIDTHSFKDGNSLTAAVKEFSNLSVQNPRYSDVGQGYYVEAYLQGSIVYLLQTDFDALHRLEDSTNKLFKPSDSPGRIVLGDVIAHWYSVDYKYFKEACDNYIAMIEFLKIGRP